MKKSYYSYVSHPWRTWHGTCTGLAGRPAGHLWWSIRVPLELTHTNQATEASDAKEQV